MHPRALRPRRLFDHHSQPVFPAATIWCGEADLDLVLDGGIENPPHIQEGLRRTTHTLRPMRGTVSIAPGISALPAPGHTPGSYLVEIVSRGARLLLIGDVTTCPAQLDEPGWHSFGDFSPGLVDQTRTHLRREAAERPAIAVGAHSPELRPVRLDQTGHPSN